MTSACKQPIVVVGGGVGGLATAFRLRERGAAVLVLEARAHLGGNIRTEAHDGFLYDCGPDSFLRTKPEGKALCEDVGLGDELITPEAGASKVYVGRDGVLHPMPEGLALGFPTRLGALLSTPLLSGEGKLRAMLEPFVPPRGSWPHDEESIAEFCRRRVGTEMGERIVAPLLSGVFAGDAERLSMQASFPQLLALEQKAGSLFAGTTGGNSLWATLTRDKKKMPSPFLSLKRGLGSLVEALRERLPEGSVRTRAPVVRVMGAGQSGARVILRDGSAIDACHVVLAGPPWSARKLLAGLDVMAAGYLDEVRGAPTATVFFGLDQKHVSHPMDGSGFIVPPGEGEILASTWTSSKWAGRAPAGTALVRAFLGGARNLSIEGKSDEELVQLAGRELRRFMGELGPISFARVFRYDRGTPQPELGHLERLERLRERLENHPWLSLVGPGYGGVGIPDCVRQAKETAERLAG